MAFKSFYRTYRPQVFDDVVGQEHIVTTLKNALKTNRVSHAYLFCGPRGTGKTTLAKILAKAVNCENENAPCGHCEHCIEIGQGTFPDVIEIDAASNNGVDEIRDLIEKVKYAPLEGKMKVYIIDEVHMLSQGAFNALLKTLEEPPEHVIFVLATTEAHKVLPTIVSRCQRFDFKRIRLDQLSAHLKNVLEKENISFEEGVCDLIASLSDGGVRDALTILEQCVTYSDESIQLKDVYEMNGVTTPEERYNLLVAIQKGNLKEVYQSIDVLKQKNIDIQRLMNDFIELLKDASIYTFSKNEDYLKPMDIEVVKKIAKTMRVSQMLEIVDILMDTIDKARYTNNTNAYFELAIIKLVELDQSIEEVVEETPKKIESKPKAKEPVPETSTTIQSVDNETEVPIEEAENAWPEDVTEEPVFVDETTLFNDSETKEQPETVKEVSWDLQDLVAYMLAANKENKAEDQQGFKGLDSLSMDTKWIQLARYLKNAPVVLSGEYFTFVAVEYQSRATQINELSTKLFELSDVLLGKRKHIFAITKDTFDQAVELFKQQSLAKTLPQPKKVEAPIVNEKMEEAAKKQDVPEGIFELFGDDIEIE